VAIDDTGALQAYTRACDIGELQGEACTAAGLILLAGKTAAPDPAGAADFFERGCDARRSDGRACFELARLLEQEGNTSAGATEQVLALYRQACRLADIEWPPACAAAGAYIKAGKPGGETTDTERDYYNYGCLRDHQQACRLACELACAANQQWGCAAIASGNIPRGVSACLADGDDTSAIGENAPIAEQQMIPTEMQELMQQYMKDHPEQAEALRQQLEAAN
jgi:TPR repeat protein